MLLRSGAVYDSAFPYYMKEFCHFGNPEFCRIWDEAALRYNHHITEDLFNKSKHREARKLFRSYLENEVKKIYLL